MRACWCEAVNALPTILMRPRLREEDTGSLLLLRRRFGGRGLGLARRVGAEEPRRRELAELVADHVLGHVDLHEAVAVVDHERVAHELGDHVGAARPRLE